MPVRRVPVVYMDGGDVNDDMFAPINSYSNVVDPNSGNIPTDQQLNTSQDFQNETDPNRGSGYHLMPSGPYVVPFTGTPPKMIGSHRHIPPDANGQPASSNGVPFHKVMRRPDGVLVTMGLYQGDVKKGEKYYDYKWIEQGPVSDRQTGEIQGLKINELLGPYWNGTNPTDPSTGIAYYLKDLPPGYMDLIKKYWDTGYDTGR